MKKILTQNLVANSNGGEGGVVNVGFFFFLLILKHDIVIVIIFSLRSVSLMWCAYFLWKIKIMPTDLLSFCHNVLLLLPVLLHTFNCNQHSLDTYSFVHCGATPRQTTRTAYNQQILVESKLQATPMEKNEWKKNRKEKHHVWNIATTTTTAATTTTNQFNPPSELS